MFKKHAQKTALVTALFTGATAFSALANHDVLAAMPEMAKTKIENHDKAKALCGDFNQIVIPKLRQAGVSAKLHANFVDDRAECRIFLGDGQLKSYKGDYIDDYTNERLADAVIEALPYDDLLKVRDVLPGLIAVPR